MNQYSSYQLPCKTFVSCGKCAYNGRCQFLHDTRIMYKYSRSIIRKKDKLEKFDNIFFLPKMNNIYCNNNNEYICQYTDIMSYDNYLVIYSMWNYFIDNISNSNKIDKIDNSLINKYTNRKRLDIFIKLSGQ